MSKKNVKIRSLLPWLVAAGFAFLFFGAVTFFQQQSSAPPSETAISEPKQENTQETTLEVKQTPEGSLVTRVIDGDTIELEDGTRVRYIGVDTPEPGQCFGGEATAANVGLVEKRKVKLELDIERKDKYGRSLAYVWVGETLVNEELVKEGFATVTTYPPNVMYVDRFLSAQKEARDQSRGLWNPSSCSQQQTVDSGQSAAGSTSQTDCVIKGNISSSGEKIYHMPGQRYYERTKIEESNGERWFCSEEDAVQAGWRKSKV